MSSNTEILSTGFLWKKGGTSSLSAKIEEVLNATSEELIIVAYRISSTNKFMEQLEKLLINEIRVTLIINHLESAHQEEVSKLFTLSEKYHSFHLYEFSDQRMILHAKVIISDNHKAIIGSANFSNNGLDYNHEMAVFLQGKIVSEVSKSTINLIKEGQRMNYVKRIERKR